MHAQHTLSIQPIKKAPKQTLSKYPPPPPPCYLFNSLYQNTPLTHPPMHPIQPALSIQAIARINLHVAILAIVCFGVEFGTDLKPWIDFMITGVCFFLCCISLFINYFAYTAYYLLSGYDLDKNLNVVKITAAPAAAGAAR